MDQASVWMMSIALLNLTIIVTADLFKIYTAYHKNGLSSYTISPKAMKIISISLKLSKISFVFGIQHLFIDGKKKLPHAFAAWWLMFDVWWLSYSIRAEKWMKWIDQFETSRLILIQW